MEVKIAIEVQLTTVHSTPTRNRRTYPTLLTMPDALQPYCLIIVPHLPPIGRPTQTPSELVTQSSFPRRLCDKPKVRLRWEPILYIAQRQIFKKLDFSGEVEVLFLNLSNLFLFVFLDKDGKATELEK